VWQSPFYWYGLPALFYLWFEKVLEHGFAYGRDAHAVSGKPLLWVTTAGTPRSAYRSAGIHGHPFEAFTHSVEQTARFCGMQWEQPIVVFDAHDASEDDLAAHARAYRERIETLSRSTASVETSNSNG
jgi:putative NADPH-quinone reductase